MNSSPFHWIMCDPIKILIMPALYNFCLTHKRLQYRCVERQSKALASRRISVESLDRIQALMSANVDLEYGSHGAK